MTASKFDPSQYLTKLKGKDYLEVKWRMVWFRDAFPYGTIVTHPIELTNDRAVFRATVTAIDQDGVIRGSATGTKSETPKGFADYIEKAETGSIGRALAALGFGTQFAPELEEGERIVDSPVAKPAPAVKPSGPVSDADFLTMVQRGAGVPANWKVFIEHAGTDQARWDLLEKHAPSDTYRDGLKKKRPAAA